MKDLCIEFNDFFTENKKLITAEKIVFRLYEAFNPHDRDPIRDDLHSALISLRHVLWLKFSLYSTEKGAFAFCDEAEVKKVVIALYKKFEFHFPRPTPYFCNAEYRKALQRKCRKQGDQDE